MWFYPERQSMRGAYHKVDEESPAKEEFHTEPKPRVGIVWKGFITIFTLSFALNIFLVFNWLAMNLDHICTEHTASHHSPVLNDVEITFRPQTFFPGFYNQSVFQQDGGPAVDTAWRTLGIDFTEMIISPDEGVAAGLEGRIRLPDSMGGGYPALMESMHQLHCLNLIRQSVYYNYPYYSTRKEHAFAGTLENLRLHVGHCIENIRQNLMCNADFNVMGFLHVAGREPFPDFGTEHTCRNFDAVHDFARRRKRDQGYNATEFPLREGDIVLDEAP